MSTAASTTAPTTASTTASTTSSTSSGTTRRRFATHPLVVRRVEVLRVADVSPRMRRVTLGGVELGAFTRGSFGHPAFDAPGFDDHVKLVLASDGDVHAAAPVQMEHGIEWGPSDTRLTRDYTPRAVRQGPAGPELDLDFVLHGDGPAAAWATTAAVGDELVVVGPKSSTRLSDGITRIVLAGDETALPAIGRFLDERPLDVPATVAVVIGEGSARQELALRPGDTIEWVVGDAADPDLLDDLVRRACVARGNGDDARLYVWAAGESRALLPVRRYLTRELGLARSHIDVTGYWHTRPAAAAPRPRTVGPDASQPDEARRNGANRNETHRDEIQPVASPLPWLVVRAALQLGVVDAVADAPGLPAADLAARCRVGVGDLDLLLPVLRAHGVLTGPSTSLRLGPLGEDLIDDEHDRERFDGFDAETVLALTTLAPAMHAGRSPWAERHGTGLDAWAAGDPTRYAELVENAGTLTYLLDGLVAHPVWHDVARVAVTGPGAALLVGALAETGRSPRTEVWESRAGITALRAELEPPVPATWVALDDAGPDPRGDVDLAVAVMALAHRTDEEATALLCALGERTAAMVLIESSRPDGLSPRAAEAALLGYAATGAPLRDAAAITALAAGAGLRVVKVVPLGWGVEATFLAQEAGTASSRRGTMPSTV